MRLLALILALWPAIAAAQSSQGTFDVYVGGLNAGTLAFAGEERDGRYAARGRLTTSGLVNLFRPVRYEASVSGRTDGARYAPSRYAETFARGDRAGRATIAYSGGVPGPRVNEPPRDPRPEHLDPATQGGTVDPMTAIWGALRDVPAERACRFSATMFDGARRSLIRMADPQRTGDTITCTGEYRRIAGFDPDDLRKKSRFPFRATYRPAASGLWRVERIDTDTLYGKGALVRR